MSYLEKNKETQEEYTYYAIQTKLKKMRYIVLFA